MLPAALLTEIIKSRARPRMVIATICGALTVLSTLQSSYDLILSTTYEVSNTIILM